MPPSIARIIGIGNEVIHVDDVIETANHFRCIDLIIESARRHFGPADENAPVVELSIPLASSLVRYTELQAEKSDLNREVKRVENEMKRLQGRIVAEMGRSCTATATSGDDPYNKLFSYLGGGTDE